MRACQWVPDAGTLWGLASPWRLPALHSLARAREEKRGKGRTRRPEKQRIRAAERWLPIKCQNSMESYYTNGAALRRLDARLTARVIIRSPNERSWLP
jgi:hypothetical protein